MIPVTVAFLLSLLVTSGLDAMNAKRLNGEKFNKNKQGLGTDKAEEVAVDSTEEYAKEEAKAAKTAAAAEVVVAAAVATQVAAEKAAAEKLAAAEKSGAEEAAAEEAVAKEVAAEKSTAEKVAAEKSTAEKVAAEEGAAGETSGEKAAAEKAATGKASAEEVSSLSLQSSAESEQLQSNTQAAVPLIFALLSWHTGGGQLALPSRKMPNQFWRAPVPKLALEHPRGRNNAEDPGIVASPRSLEPARAVHLTDASNRQGIADPFETFSIKVNRELPRPETLGVLKENSWLAFVDKHSSAELSGFLQDTSLRQGSEWATDLRKFSTAVGQELLGLQTPVTDDRRREQALLTAKECSSNEYGFSIWGTSEIQYDDNVALFETDADYVAIIPYFSSQNALDDKPFWLQVERTKDQTASNLHIDASFLIPERQDVGSLFILNLWKTLEENKQLLFWVGVTAKDLLGHALLRPEDREYRFEAPVWDGSLGRSQDGQPGMDHSQDVEQVKKAAAQDEFALTSLPGDGSMTVAFVSASSSTDGEKMPAAIPHAGVLHNPESVGDGDLLSRECRFYIQFIPKIQKMGASMRAQDPASQIPD